MLRMTNDLAAIGALIGDATRARMLAALMSGVALTATELADEAEVTRSTASAHLERLCSGRLITVDKQGRHRYFRIADASIAGALEQLGAIAPPSRRRGPSDPALRRARVCYDHLAGERGVWMFDQLRAREFLTADLRVTSHGKSFFTQCGIDIDALAVEKRPLTRSCLDWTERRPHLGGSVGAAILDRVFALRWARRDRSTRALLFSPAGARAFERLLVP